MGVLPGVAKVLFSTFRPPFTSTMIGTNYEFNSSGMIRTVIELLTGLWYLRTVYKNLALDPNGSSTFVFHLGLPKFDSEALLQYVRKKGGQESCHHKIDS